VLGPQGIDWGQEIDIRPAHPAATTTDPLFLPVDNPNPKALGLQRWTFYSPFVFKTKIAWPYYDNCEHGYTPPIR